MKALKDLIIQVEKEIEMLQEQIERLEDSNNHNTYHLKHKLAEKLAQLDTLKTLK